MWVAGHECDLYADSRSIPTLLDFHPGKFPPAHFFMFVFFGYPKHHICLSRDNTHCTCVIGQWVGVCVGSPLDEEIYLDFNFYQCKIFSFIFFIFPIQIFIFYLIALKYFGNMFLCVSFCCKYVSLLSSFYAAPKYFPIIRYFLLFLCLNILRLNFTVVK